MFKMIPRFLQHKHSETKATVIVKTVLEEVQASQNK